MDPESFADAEKRMSKHTQNEVGRFKMGKKTRAESLIELIDSIGSPEWEEDLRKMSKKSPKEVFVVGPAEEEQIWLMLGLQMLG